MSSNLFFLSLHFYLNSPHIRTIRERMSVGLRDEPVPEELLHSVFVRIRRFLDQAVANEHGFLSHFEVDTHLLCYELYEKIEF